MINDMEMDSLVAIGSGNGFIYSLVLTFLITDHPHLVHQPDFYSLASRYKKRVTTIKPEKQNRTRTFQVFNVIFVLNLLRGSSWYYIMVS